MISFVSHFLIYNVPFIFQALIYSVIMSRLGHSPFDHVSGQQLSCPQAIIGIGDARPTVPVLQTQGHHISIIVKKGQDKLTVLLRKNPHHDDALKIVWFNDPKAPTV
jgi:hypothetical protein